MIKKTATKSKTKNSPDPFNPFEIWLKTGGPAGDWPNHWEPEKEFTKK